MKKNTVKENITAIKRISSKLPKSLNEAIHFNDLETEDDEMMMDEPMDSHTDEPMDAPMGKHMGSDDAMGDEHSDIDEFIDNMRESSLGIMKKLARKPDDPVYQFAKKIFQLSDKAHEDQKEGKDINGQPQQQPQQPQRHM